MTQDFFRALHHRIALVGGHVVSGPAVAHALRLDKPAINPATLVESPLRHIDPGSAQPWDEPVAFLDGVQNTRLIGRLGTSPIVGARIAAGVRLRTDRQPQGITALEQYLVIGRVDAIASLGDLPTGTISLSLDETEHAHPVGDLDSARALVDSARTRLELEAARQFREDRPDCWLIVDGTITVSPEWATDSRMLGIVKSHNSLPFDGTELECYLTLAAGHRTSVFMPASRRLTPVYSWGLRLWAWEDHDLMHGLVRVETAATAEALDNANVLACRLLAERAPLANDPRRDRLLYGIHDVERWLRAWPSCAG